MTFGSKIFYPLTFLLIFLMIFIIGVTSEVSFSASFTRAALAGAVFTVLTWAVTQVISIYVFPSAPTDDLNPENTNLGANFDLTVSDSDGTDQSEPEPKAPPAKDSSPKIPDEFVPMSARQIDPEVSRIINNDPQKAAEIIRKMGFDEDE